MFVGATVVTLVPLLVMSYSGTRFRKPIKNGKGAISVAVESIRSGAILSGSYSIF